MNKIVISKRHLKESEIIQLISDIRFYPDLTYVSEKRWKKIKPLYVIEANNIFAGVCAVYEFNNWIKVGPLVLLKKFHSQGYGKQLILKILKSYPDKNILVISSNPKVKTILNKFGFTKKNIFTLSLAIKYFLFKQLIEYLSIQCLIEAARKRLFMKRGSISFFVK